MLKKIFIASLIAVTAFACTACSNTTRNQLADQISKVAQLISGDVTGETGKSYATQWFEFTVVSITPVAEYAGYTPADGNRLLDVVITEKGTFSDPSPMGTFDFYLDSPSFDDYIYPLDPLDESMMPYEFTLEKGQAVDYHMVYEFPSDFSDLKLMYTEIDETEQEGVTFTINVEL
ncbi:MAG: hypothetical protein LBT22_08630 [Peptococcaceae bacterium]|jgi:hypothetical protein|nr:hypothetical protein [Peptococcaceae bacterium]